MLTSADRELWLVLNDLILEESQALPMIQKALIDGANPNLANRDFNNFESAVGLAVWRAWPNVVSTLIESGGELTWPGGEKDIDVMELCGEPDISYGGKPCDPFMLAMDELGWRLAEYTFHDAAERARADRLVDIAHSLMTRGVDITRPDPATARSPLDHLVTILVENTERPIADEARTIFSEFFYQCIIHQAPLLVADISQGNWDALPFCKWEWHEDFPELAQAVQILAQRDALGQGTPLSSTPRRTTRL